MHPPEGGDTYLDDGIHYRLSVELEALVSEPMEPDPERPGRGGHGVHGEWWWANEVPADVVLERVLSASAGHNPGQSSASSESREGCRGPENRC